MRSVLAKWTESGIWQRPLRMAAAAQEAKFMAFATEGEQHVNGWAHAVVYVGVTAFWPRIENSKEMPRGFAAAQAIAVLPQFSFLQPGTGRLPSRRSWPR